jgi:hypothetical protein
MMIRVAFAALFTLAICAGGLQLDRANSAGFLLLTKPGSGGTGCTDADCTAWVNAVVAAGGTVSTTQGGRVNTLITNLKGHTLWNTALSRIWIHASENEFQAKIDIVNVGAATKTGGLTFTASQGYTGDGVNYLDSGFSNDALFTLNDCSFGNYIRNNRTTGANTDSMGVTRSSGGDAVLVPLVSGSFFYEINDSVYPSPVNTSTQGLWAASRKSSSTQENLYKNGSLFSGPDTSNTSSALSAQTFYILGLNQNGTPNNFSTDQVAITFMGAGLDATQAANLSSDLNAYMTALGTNVY